MTIDKDQIAELESLRVENTRLDAGWRDSNFCWFKAAKELETLRARLAELEKQEPVGVFADVNALTPEQGKRWEQMVDSAYDGVGYVHLFAAPVVSPDVEKLKAERDYHLTNAKSVYAECSELKAENQSLKTELAKATHQVEISERDLAASVLEKMELVSELEAARKDAEKFKLLVGEMRDGMVVWFDVNPHGAPEGTQYYVSIEQAKGGA